MLPQQRALEAQGLDVHRPTIGVEAATVEADVEEPVVERVLRLGRRGIEQELRLRLFAFDAEFGLESWSLVEADHRHAIHWGKHLPGEQLEKVLVGVVPENDPLFVEEFFEGFGDLLGVHA